MATQPVSSDPSTPLEQAEKESIEQVKSIDKESRNDSVPDIEKEYVSGGTDGDGLDKDLEETTKRVVDESEAEVIKPESELKPAVAKEDVEVKDLSEKIEVPEVSKTEGVEVAEKINVDASKDAEPVSLTQNVTEVPTSEGVEIIDAKEENVVVNDDVSSVPEAIGITEEIDKTELPESGVEVNEVKENSEGIEPSESLDDVAKESSEKTEILESSVPEASNVELEQSEAEITEAKEVKSKDLSDEKNETTKESAESDAVDKFEIDGAKEEENQAKKLVAFELKSESVPEEDSTVVDEAKGNSDVSETSRDIELAADIEGKKDETLATILKNDADIEVEKKADAEESLESETETKQEDLSDGNAEITEQLKEVVPTESTEKTDINAAKDEQFLSEPVADTEDTNAGHIDTKDPTSETIQNIDTQDPIKKEDDTNSIKTSATDAETEENKEDPVVPEAKKIEETTQVSDYVSKVDQTSKEIQLPATNEEPQESKIETIKEEFEENTKLDAPNEEPDDVKTKEEEVVPKQKQSNNLLSKVKLSLVKAKKAIIKKNPSKTPPTS